MRKVGIIGMGHVGSTVAYTLFTHGIADELVLIDKNQKKCEAEFNDLRDALARNDYHVDVKMQDWDELKNVDVLITSFGDIAATVKTGDRFGEFNINAQNAKEVGKKIKDSEFNGILINISNPCDAITMLLKEYSGIARNKIFGTGTFLDTARMQRIVGEKLNQDPRNVEGYVLGEHGSSQFTAWSTVSINNKSAMDLFNKQEREQLSTQPNKNSIKVAQGKGYTSYAIATCAAKLTQAVFSDAKLYAPVSTYVASEKTYIGYPAIVGKSGIEKVFDLDLTDDEQQKLDSSADKIKEHLNSLK